MDPYSSLILRQYNTNQCKLLNIICTIQEEIEIKKLNYNTIYFIYKDKYKIVNPFKDKTKKYTVDPIKYYGEYFLKSDFINLLDKCKVNDYVSSSRLNKLALEKIKEFKIEDDIEIDLNTHISKYGFFNKYILKNKHIGYILRDTLDLDTLDKKNNKVIVKIPNEIDIGNSFILGIIEDSLIELGVEKFKDKYIFVGNKYVTEFISNINNIK